MRLLLRGASLGLLAFIAVVYSLGAVAVGLAPIFEFGAAKVRAEPMTAIFLAIVNASVATVAGVMFASLFRRNLWEFIVLYWSSGALMLWFVAPGVSASTVVALALSLALGGWLLHREPHWLGFDAVGTQERHAPHNTYEVP